MLTCHVDSLEKPSKLSPGCEFADIVCGQLPGGWRAGASTAVAGFPTTSVASRHTSSQRCWQGVSGVTGEGYFGGEYLFAHFFFCVIDFYNNCVSPSDFWVLLFFPPQLGNFHKFLPQFSPIWIIRSWSFKFPECEIPFSNLTSPLRQRLCLGVLLLDLSPARQNKWFACLF